MGGLAALSVTALCLIWSFVTFQPFFRWELRRGKFKVPLTWQENATVAWTGMRIITLAYSTPYTTPRSGEIRKETTGLPGRPPEQISCLDASS